MRYPHICRTTWYFLTIDFLLNFIEDCSWIKTFTKTCSWQNVNNCTFSLLSSILYLFQILFSVVYSAVLFTVLDIYGKPMNVGSFSFQSIIQNLVLLYLPSTYPFTLILISIQLHLHYGKVFFFQLNTSFKCVKCVKSQVFSFVVCHCCFAWPMGGPPNPRQFNQLFAV